MVDLSPHQLKEVSEILLRFVPEYQVMVFGSRVSGGAKAFSDLDLSIKSDKPLPLGRLSELKLAFTESNLPFRVDVVDWSRTDKNFQKIIAQSAQVFPTAPK